MKRLLIGAALVAAFLFASAPITAIADTTPTVVTTTAPVVAPALAAPPVAVAPAPTVTVVEPATNQNAFGYLVDLAFVAIGALVVIFAPKLWMAVFHTAPPPGALEAILKIIDNGFDLADVEVKKLVPSAPGATIDFHNETLNFVEKFVLEFAKPEQMKALGLTAATLRTWLAAEFAPAT